MQWDEPTTNVALYFIGIVYAYDTTIRFGFLRKRTWLAQRTLHVITPLCNGAP